MSEAVPPGFEPVLQAVAPLAAAFGRAGHRLYLVGGVVRDHLLGLDRHDNDLDATTDARPPQIKAIVADLAEAVWLQGERFGTIGCIIDGQVYEITTHRTEVYADDSRKPEVVFGDVIDDDLARRDFTVNAMAVDLTSRVLIDPFDGRGDLDRRVLRTPLSPEIAFSEDPLRMLRAARFLAGYGLEPTDELRAAVTGMGARMEIVSAERIRDELDKLLGLADSAPGLRFLASTGLMRWVVPELAGLDGPVLERVARRVVEAGATPAGRWAALLFEVADADHRLAELRASGAHRAGVEALLSGREWLDDAAVPSGGPAIRRAMGAPRHLPIDDVVAFMQALRVVEGLDPGVLDRLGAEIAALRAVDPDLDQPPPLLSGRDVIRILGVDEGPTVGRAMAFLAELRILEGPLDRATATERLEVWWAALGGSATE